MSLQRLEETDRFWVRDDDGNEYEIVERTEILSDRRRGRLGTTIPGFKRYRTTDDRAVNRRGEKYEILTDGFEPTVMATRID